MTTVSRWTGREAKLLRAALRLSVRDFAARLGIGVRTVNKWEARQADITPLPYMQEVLDTALAQASDEAKARFADSALLKRYDELVVAKHEYAASQLESSQADHLAAAECLRSEPVVTSTVAGSDVPGELVDDVGRDPVLSAPWNHRGTVKASVALSGGGSPVERRCFALLTGVALTVPAHQWLIRDPEPLLSGLSGGRVSVALVDQLPAMITRLRTMDDAAGGGSVFSLAQQAFGWLSGLLDQASYNERTGRRLHIALAELGQLAGWAAHDAGRPGLGQRYHVAALRAAHSADDRPLGAHILGCMADQAARHGRPAEAVTLIETAVVGIRGWETPRLLAELYIRKAYALATMKDGSACVAAVAKARMQVEQFEPDSDPRWLYWVTPAEVTAGAGDCLLQLGQPGHATALLDGVIARFDESFARDRQIYLTHLADALARPGKQRDLDAAADRGLAAVHLAESLTSTRGTDCLRDLYGKMQPHASVPAVGDFLERARGVLAA
ncbi:MAG: helix-turn-helix domain-containing protein [Pseudonocardiaceae bacterium]